MKWRFAENSTDVSEGLTPRGTSQGDVSQEGARDSYSMYLYI